MRFVLFTIIAFLISGNGFAGEGVLLPVKGGFSQAEVACAPKNENLSNITRAIVKAQVPKDIKKFCETTQSDYKNFDSNKDFNPNRVSNGGLGVWQASLVPSVKYRKAALLSGLNNTFLDTYSVDSEKALRISFQITEKDVFTYANNFLNAAPANWSKPIEISQGYFIGETDQKKDIQQSMAAKAALCGSYSVMGTVSCTKALDRIIELMKPVHDLNLVPVVKEVYADKSYNQGLLLAAKNLLKRVKDNDLSDGDLFSELVASYSQTGMSTAEAEKHAWNIIGIISTNGPNSASYIRSAFGNGGELSPQFLAAIQVLSTAPLVLDSMRLAAGKPSYSYPPEFSTTCDYSKPYHFWMSAFLAHKMGEEFGSADAGVHAAWIAQMGYQMRSKTTGRDPTRAFMTDCFGIANNKIRLDLAFASAGASYGMKQYQNAKVPKKNIDEAIQRLMSDATPAPKLTKVEALALWADYGGVKGYARWRGIFSPDSALNYYLSP